MPKHPAAAAAVRGWEGRQGRYVGGLLPTITHRLPQRKYILAVSGEGSSPSCLSVFVRLEFALIRLAHHNDPETCWKSPVPPPHPLRGWVEACSQEKNHNLATWMPRSSPLSPAGWPADPFSLPTVKGSALPLHRAALFFAAVATRHVADPYPAPPGLMCSP